MQFNAGAFVRNLKWSLELLLAQAVELTAKIDGLPADWSQDAPPIEGVALIGAERMRQQLVKGYGPAHDDEHRNGALSAAATEFLLSAVNQDRKAQSLPSLALVYFYKGPRDESLGLPRHPWPDFSKQLHKHSRAQALLIGAALAAAEIDRLLRAHLVYWCDNCGQLFDIEMATDAAGRPTLPNGPDEHADTLLQRGERALCLDCAGQRRADSAERRAT